MERNSNQDSKNLKNYISTVLSNYPIVHNVAKSFYHGIVNTKRYILAPTTVGRELKGTRSLIKSLEDRNMGLLQDYEMLLNKIGILQNGLEEEKHKNILLNKKIYEINQTNALEQKNIMYFHGGSGNHGCEALVRTIASISEFKREETCIYSYVSNDDYKFNINEIAKYIKQSQLDTTEIDTDYFSPGTIALSVGGDNYCDYGYGTICLAKYNKKFNDMGVKTALVGCSIEPYILEDDEVLKDLDRFSLITARESITYEALIKAGIKRNTHLIPDSAFTLEAVYKNAPEGFEEGNTVGINISNLIQKYDNEGNIAYVNYQRLIEYIINKTKYQIALIPHVVQKHNDDFGTLLRLYNEYKSTGRLVIIEDNDCKTLKGYISRCKMVVAARTHASIAAYSTMVPTLVLGYSVKSRGIAKDIFGTDENYVLSVQSLKAESDLTKAFIWLDKNYHKIKNHLNEVMPNYINRAYDLKKCMEDLKVKENPKMGLAPKNECTGCGACFNICPHNCIQMLVDKEGFKYPSVDYNKCTNCGLCKNVCTTNIDVVSSNNVVAYMAKHKDLDVRLGSSSGGIFTALASVILKRKGIVFGACLNSDNKVKHIEVTKLEDLEKMRGSKYVQSDTSDVFTKVKQYLNDDKKVLFSGTPCQIQGLKFFLKKDYNNLFCIDIVCHGVPSPKVFEYHFKQFEEEYSSTLKKINFRNKTKSWKHYEIEYILADGRSIIVPFAEDIYMKAFLSNLSLRQSCYSCRANNFRSTSDLTLGDLWGVEVINPDFDDDRGTSIVLVNTENGRHLLDEIKDDIILESVDLDNVVRYNPSIVESARTNWNRQNFFNEIENKNIKALVDENA